MLGLPPDAAEIEEFATVDRRLVWSLERKSGRDAYVLDVIHDETFRDRCWPTPWVHSYHLGSDGGWHEHAEAGEVAPALVIPGPLLRLLVDLGLVDRTRMWEGEAPWPVEKQPIHAPPVARRSWWHRLWKRGG